MQQEPRAVLSEAEQLGSEPDVPRARQSKPMAEEGKDCNVEECHSLQGSLVGSHSGDTAVASSDSIVPEDECKPAEGPQLESDDETEVHSNQTILTRLEDALVATSNNSISKTMSDGDLDESVDGLPTARCDDIEPTINSAALNDDNDSGVVSFVSNGETEVVTLENEPKFDGSTMNGHKERCTEYPQAVGDVEANASVTNNVNDVGDLGISNTADEEVKLGFLADDKLSQIRPVVVQYKGDAMEPEAGEFFYDDFSASNILDGENLVSSQPLYPNDSQENDDVSHEQERRIREGQPVTDDAGCLGDFSAVAPENVDPTESVDTITGFSDLIENTNAGDAQKRSKTEDDDDFGDFSDFGSFEDAGPDMESAGLETPPAEQHDNQTVPETRDVVQPNVANDDDDDEFGDFGDFTEFTDASTTTECRVAPDESIAPKESTKPDSGVSEKSDLSTGTLGDTIAGNATCVFSQIFAKYVDDAEQENTDSFPSRTILSVQDILSILQNDTNADKPIWSREGLTTVLMDAAHLGPSKPSAVVNEDCAYPYAHFSFPPGGLSMHFTKAQQGEVPGIVPNQYSCTEEPFVRKHEPAPSRDSQRSVAIIASLPPPAQLPGSSVQNGIGKVNADFADFRPTDAESGGSRVETFTVSNKGPLSQSARQFLAQVPDLSFMLKSTLSPPKET